MTEHLEQHRPMLMRQALNLAGQRADAEDLVQDTLVKAIAAWDSFDGRNIRGWLTVIQHRTFIDHARKTRPLLLFDAEQLDTETVPSAETLVLDGTLSPDLTQALRALPAGQQAAVMHVDAAGMRAVDYAHAAGIPRATVNTRLHRGRAQMRAALPDRDRSTAA